MGLQIIHLRAASEPCGGRAQIELVGHSQPESSGGSCHFMQTLAQLSVKLSLLHYAESISVRKLSEKWSDLEEMKDKLVLLLPICSLYCMFK